MSQARVKKIHILKPQKKLADLFFLGLELSSILDLCLFNLSKINNLVRKSI